MLKKPGPPSLVHFHYTPTHASWVNLVEVGFSVPTRAELRSLSATARGIIDRKTKEMLIIVACVASGDLVSHLQIHMHGAHRARATPEEILEALKLVGSWIGIRRVTGLEAWTG